MHSEATTLPLPKYDDLMHPALVLLNEQNTMRLKEFELPMAQALNLTDDAILQEYPSGNGRIFYDRISWALSHLRMAGLVAKPKRAVYELNDAGRAFLQKPGEIKTFVKKIVSERSPSPSQSNTSANTAPKLTENNSANGNSQQTPQEELLESASQIKTAVCQDILDAVLSKHPRAFEKLVVDLLQRMGYGGQVEGSAVVTQYSNDGGVDGLIKEDPLGLGRIYIQAKRYAQDRNIGSPDIQAFVGALAGQQSNKGIFITTSSYSQHARDYVRSLNGHPSVVLIDGTQLANHIYETGLGMQIEQVIEIKKLDSEFWDELADA